MRPFLTLHHPADARRYYERGLWTEDTFYSLLSRHAEERPNAPALQDGRRMVSWSELRLWVDGVAASLREYGLVGGDRVSIWMSNRIEAVVMFLACAREGFACNPSLHKTYTCAEIIELLSTLSARAFLTEPGWGADREKADVIAEFAGRQFSDFKTALTELAVAKLGPVATEMQRLMKDPGHVDGVLHSGAERARNLAAPILEEVYRTVGFLKP